VGRILVVDDERSVRAFLAEVLVRSGHEVDQAGDGEEALALARSQAFQVVVTDLKMPKLDGLALLEALSREQPEVEVILLTAYGTVDNAVAAMKHGAFDYLQKPIGAPAELRLVVERALERRRLRDLVEGRDEPETSLSYGAPAMQPVVSALKKVSATDATVLLLGESGTGKEVAAAAIHAWSARHQRPFVAVNCAALSAQLLESELFGHERGAFTGAHARRRGKLELADGGTFFLDEIGELAPPLQAKLLRVLQERSFERVGGGQTIRCDVRWIAATNRDLVAMIGDGTFREDLYHRIAVFPIAMPPLRERPEDIVPLAGLLLTRACARLGRPTLPLSDEAKDALLARQWSGNVRELGNALERAAILAEGDVLGPEHLRAGESPSAGARPAAEPTSLATLERQAIADAIVRHDGNRKAIAAELGISVRSLYDKIKRHEL
jgi:two-component system response regulator FlrC